MVRNNVNASEVARIMHLWQCSVVICSSGQEEDDRACSVCFWHGVASLARPPTIFLTQREPTLNKDSGPPC